MDNYKHYMDRMEPSPALHQRLMDMQSDQRHRKSQNIPWKAAAGLAACCALVLGLAGYGISRHFHPSATVPLDTQLPATEVPVSAPAEATQTPVTTLEPPTEMPVSVPDIVVDLTATSFTVEHPVVLPEDNGIQYPALAYTIDGAPALALMEGSHREDLTRADILQIFWGVVPDPYEETADMPSALCWEGYTVQGSATYLADGSLYQVGISGTKGEQSFSLSLAPDTMPFACGIYPESAVQEIRGITVRTHAYENNTEAQLMSRSVGIRMVSTGDPTLCNALIAWATQEDCPISLEHLLVPEFLPFWKDAQYDTLAEVRDAETDFLPWIPADVPFADWAFTARMTWQENMEHTLFLRWSKGYDDITITISLPQPGEDLPVPVDAGNPASYDRRLYDQPFSETVPDEYWDSVVNTPCFRLEDITMDILQSRAIPKDTGGTSYRFQVLTPDGVLLSYGLSGISAEEALDLVLQAAAQ